MDHRPKCKYKTINVPKENIGENLCSLQLGKQFRDTTPKHDPQKKRLIYVRVYQN